MCNRILVGKTKELNSGAGPVNIFIECSSFCRLLQSDVVLTVVGR